MNLLDYSRSSAAGTGTIDCPVFGAIAALADCSAGTIYQIALGHKQAGPQLAGRIEQATKSHVTREELRPDLFRPLTAVA